MYIFFVFFTNYTNLKFYTWSIIYSFPPSLSLSLFCFCFCYWMAGTNLQMLLKWIMFHFYQCVCACFVILLFYFFFFFSVICFALLSIYKNDATDPVTYKQNCLKPVCDSVIIVHPVAHSQNCLKFWSDLVIVQHCHSSGAVWVEVAVRPNKPYGFHGCKALLNHTHA